MKRKLLAGLAIILLLCLFSCSQTVDMKEYFNDEQIETLRSTVERTEKKGAVVAYGGGFDDAEGLKVIVDKTVELSGKQSPKVLFLPTAHKDVLEEHEEVVEAYQKEGYEVEILLVTKATDDEIKAKISSADIIYETGGNLDFLTNAWKERGVYQEIHRAFNRGVVLAGVSSGAMCWGERGNDDFGEEVWRITSSFPFFGKDNAFVIKEASGILPFCICPHYDNIAWAQYTKQARKLDIPSLCIDNSACVIYQGGKFEVINEKRGRSAYLFYPELGIDKVDIQRNAELMNLAYAYRCQTYTCAYRE